MTLTKTSILYNFPVLAQLPLPVLDELNRVKQIVKIKRGGILVKKGESINKLGVITRGIVRTYSANADHTEDVFTFFKEGDFCVDPFGFFQDKPAAMTLQALEDTEMYSITRAQFLAIGKQFPDFLTHSYQLLSAYMMKHAQEKNILLTMSAKDRYLYFLNTYPELIHRVPLGHVSSFLSMRQSSLSRIRRDVSKGRS